jgi:Domain of unknown function (DUF4387)
MNIRLIDIASVIRSKNAGPGELTLDIIFQSRDWFDRVVAAGVIDKALIARLYKQDVSQVESVIAFEPAAAIKATLRRPLVSGMVGDTDVYGAQQHAPLLDLVFDI